METQGNISDDNANFKPEFEIVGDPDDFAAIAETLECTLAARIFYEDLTSAEKCDGNTPVKAELFFYHNDTLEPVPVDAYEDLPLLEDIADGDMTVLFSSAAMDTIYKRIGDADMQAGFRRDTEAVAAYEQTVKYKQLIEEGYDTSRDPEYFLVDFRPENLILLQDSADTARPTSNIEGMELDEDVPSLVLVSNGDPTEHATPDRPYLRALTVDNIARIYK